MAETFWTINQVAEALSVAKRTIRRWLHRPHNPLPAFKPGGKHLVFVPEDVERWVREHKARPYMTGTPRTLKRRRSTAPTASSTKE